MTDKEKNMELNLVKITTDALEDLGMQLSSVNDLLQIFLAFVEEDFPTDGENEQIKALVYVHNSKLYTTAVSVASEKLVSAIQEINRIVENRNK